MTVVDIFRRHPLAVLALIGVAIRVAISPFLSNIPDISAWANVVENIRAGEGLYDVKGFYYTPVWGYVLEVYTQFLNLLDIGYLSVDANEEEMFGMVLKSVSTPAFNALVKLPLIAADVAIAFVLHAMAKDLTGDDRRGVTLFAVWMLFPCSIIGSSILGMFDNLAVLFLLLSIFFVRRDRMVLSGVALSLSVMTKFFTVAAVIPMVVYMLTDTKGDRASRCLVFLVSFVLTSILLVLPYLVSGDISEVLNFAFLRLDDGSSESLSDSGLWTLVGSIGALVLGLVLIMLLFRLIRDRDRAMLVSCTFIIGIVILANFHFRYFIQVLPLLFLLWGIYSYPMKPLLVLAAVMQVLFELTQLPLRLYSYAYFSSDSLMSWVRDAFEWESGSWFYGLHYNDFASYCLAAMLAVLVLFSSRRVISRLKLSRSTEDE